MSTTRQGLMVVKQGERIRLGVTTPESPNSLFPKKSDCILAGPDWKLVRNIPPAFERGCFRFSRPWRQRIRKMHRKADEIRKKEKPFHQLPLKKKKKFGFILFFFMSSSPSTDRSSRCCYLRKRKKKRSVVHLFRQGDITMLTREIEISWL